MEYSKFPVETAMNMKRYVRWLSQALVLATLIAGTLFGNSSGAWPAGNFGYQSISYSGVANPPTSDKPQSKLWWNDGSWWADMWTTGSGWHIYRLDRATKTWVDTGLRNDTRGNTLADTLWDGEHLYIASHVVTVSGDGTPVPGTPVIQDAASANMNNVTTTKQGVDSSTGMVVMASDHVAKRYWFSDRSLGTPTPAPRSEFHRHAHSRYRTTDCQLHRHLHGGAHLLVLEVR